MPYVMSFERLAREKGLEEGRRLGLIDSIELLLRDKFGEAAEPLLGEIREIEEIDKLKATLGAINNAATIDDLRRSWTD